MKKSFHAYDTYNVIDVRDEVSESVLMETIEEAMRLEHMLSAFRPDSEVARINRNAGYKETQVSQETCHLLKKAIAYSQQTNGAFDITIRPAVRLWNDGYKTGCLPNDNELKKIKNLIDYRKVHINMETSTVLLEEKGQEIDLGGIAKGYAADVIRSRLKENGVKNGIINFGGTVLTIGKNPNGNPWRVGIQNPGMKRGHSIGSMQVGEASVVTSAVNERFFIKDNKLYHHLLDPFTLRPSQSGLYSVTAIGYDAADLDAMTTGLFVMGLEKGVDLANKIGLDAVFLKADGSIYSTQKISNMILIKERGSHYGKEN